MSATASGQSVVAAARLRGITRLVHFTPLQNLIGMVRIGEVLPQRALLAYAEDRRDAFLLDYVRINDELRLDGRRDCVNLSIQHPNTFLFRRFRERHLACDLWVVLSFPPDLLDTPNALFTTGNAAATAVKRYGTAGGVAGFEALFADDVPSVGASCGREPAHGRLAPCYPASVQAEALLPAAIPLSRISAVSVETDEDAARVAGLLRCLDTGCLVSRVGVCPELFKERS
jgi:hypothetical protein